MDPPRSVSPQMNRRCRESQPVPRFSNSHANVWAGYGQGLFTSNEIDENFCFQPKDSLSKTMPLPFQRQPSAMSVTNSSVERPPTPLPSIPPPLVLPPVLPPLPPPLLPPLPPPVLPPLPPPPSSSGPTIGELVLAAEVRALETQVKSLTLDKNHAERLLHALVDYHAHKFVSNLRRG